MDKISLDLALIGNPNSGKTSVFNTLTGLRQKVGNYPGVTVDKKFGYIKTKENIKFRLVDLPGTYSLYPNSEEELIVSQILLDKNGPDYPDAILYVCDTTSLERHLLLFTQILDLNIPTILVLNMSDQAERKGIQLDVDYLSKEFQLPCVLVNSRTAKGYNNLLAEITKLRLNTNQQRQAFYPIEGKTKEIFTALKSELPEYGPYASIVAANHFQSYPFLTKEQHKGIEKTLESLDFNPLEHQIDETLDRFSKIDKILNKATIIDKEKAEKSLTDRIDSVITHPFLGLLIFIVMTIFIFQSIYSWATYPMDWIENGFNFLSEGIREVLPPSWFRNLLTEGVIAGITGVMIFIPQIAILFLIIALLEEFGYMARAVFLVDRFMQALGLNGRSIVALISGGACAIPAIMSTRTISNPKERLITILVTPFISCSARLPVYVILIGFVVSPDQKIGIFGLQGLLFAGLYFLGIAAALIFAFIFKNILKSKEHSFLTLELPAYKIPMLKNVMLTVYEKVKSFVFEAGKIIFFISIVLWFLSSYSLPGEMKKAELEAEQIIISQNLSEAEADHILASEKLEYSFAGKIGKWMEPVIKPLGYDWKIGIALLTSFAAREVFVGTMATIYSVGSDDSSRLREKMAREVSLDTGRKVFTLPTSLSLLIFYVFAMQCMSTLAIVKKETKSWKWPLIQFSFMTGLAYISALLVYQLSSYFMA